MSDLDLLQLEMNLLWGPDLYGRPASPHPLVALALANDGRALRFGSGVPSDLRASLAESLSHDPSPERFVGECGRPMDSRVCTSGPSYVFDGEGAPSSDHRVVTSEERVESWLEEARPEAWGDPGEWRDLLAGRLGPWAFGILGGHVVSVCYTPVASPHAAEAGIWTLPETRGRGYAPATVAAWARVAKGRFGTRFYSTGSENAASQAVARKLGLRRVGTIWQIPRL